METIYATDADVNSDTPNDANFDHHNRDKNGPRQGNSDKKSLTVDPAEINRFLEILDPDTENFLFTSFDDDKARAQLRNAYFKPHQTFFRERNKLAEQLKADPANSELRSIVQKMDAEFRKIMNGAPGHASQTKLGKLDQRMIRWMNERHALGLNICNAVQAMTGDRRLNSAVNYGRAVFAEMDERPKKPFPLEASVTYETSPGKFHHIWCIDHDERFVSVFEDVQRRLIEDFGSDPNAKDFARTLRMPGTWNLKPGRAPHMVKIVYAPGYRYSLDELMAEIKPKAAERKTYSGARASYQATGEMARFTEECNPLDKIPADEYFEWMQVGMALHHESGGSSEGLAIWRSWSQGSSKYADGDCEAKWETFSSKSGGVTGGYIYSRAEFYGWRREDLDNARARAKAQKSNEENPRNPHHEEKADAMNSDDHGDDAPPPGNAGADQPDPDKNRINIEPGTLAGMTDKAMRILADLGVDIFQRGGKLVRPVMIKGTDSRGRPTYSAGLIEVDKSFMRKTLCENIDWFKRDGRVKKGDPWKAADAPREIAEMIIASAGEWPFRTISAVISTPTLRWDGSIISQPGYDERTGLFLNSKVTLPYMPETPTKADAIIALKLLKGLLVEFPFVNAASVSVALSAMTSAVTRGMMDVCPAHGFRAPTAGTGKSYLGDIIAAIQLGERCPVISVSSDSDGETEKRIIAMAMAGQPIINLDNVNGTLHGDALCQLIERPTCNLRILGKSETVRVENRQLILFNGNNCRVQGDMTRRVLLAELDARMEKPAEREFKGDPVATVLADRGTYIAACMVLVRAYMAAGKPKVVKTPMNSFGDWSDTVRSALIWAGEVDPCETIQLARDEDPELMAVAAFVNALKPHAHGPERALPVRRIVQIGQQGMHSPSGFEAQNPDLHTFLEDFMDRGSVNAIRVGKWLKKFKGRVVDQVYRIASIFDKSANSERWFIEMVPAPENA